MTKVDGNLEEAKEGITEQEVVPYQPHTVRVYSNAFPGIPEDWYIVEKVYDQDHVKHTLYYTCKVNGCNKSFTKTCNLNDHFRIHDGKKPHVCEKCGKSYTQNGNLKKHIRRHHPSMAATERKVKSKCKRRLSDTESSEEIVPPSKR